MWMCMRRGMGVCVCGGGMSVCVGGGMKNDRSGSKSSALYFSQLKLA